MSTGGSNEIRSSSQEVSDAEGRSTVGSTQTVRDAEGRSTVGSDERTSSQDGKRLLPLHSKNEDASNSVLFLYYRKASRGHQVYGER